MANKKIKKTKLKQNNSVNLESKSIRLSLLEKIKGKKKEEKLNEKFLEEEIKKKKSEEEINQAQKPNENLNEEKEAEFLAPVINPVTQTKPRETINPLEQTAEELPNPIIEREETNMDYIGANNAYNANAGYISNQNYRSNDSNYNTQEFKPELGRDRLEKPIFGTRGLNNQPRQPGFDNSGNNARDEREQPRMMTQYEIKPEETTHHGLRKRKTEIF
ncbi:MAG: hypothetical protein AABY22_17410 [Nanoarchaeota archaeon]